jgi:hypothetical protein
MSSVSPTSQLALDLQPGKPPILTIEAPRDPLARATQHQGATRRPVTARGCVLVRAVSGQVHVLDNFFHELSRHG